MPPLPSIYIGIDPGASGGLASLRGKEAILRKLEGHSEHDVWAWMKDTASHYQGRIFALIEQVHSFPGDGHVGAFKFGKSYGGLRMALVAAGIPFDEVSPQKWTAAFVPVRLKGKKCEECWGSGWIGICRGLSHRPNCDCGGREGVCPRCKGVKKTGGETRDAFKNRLKAKAQQLFPQAKVTLATADAILLAEYCRRRKEGGG